MVYRVLSIDGGGVRGAFSLKLLKAIEDEVDKDFCKKIDCFAGTSTGGLIATCLNLGHSPKKLLFFYQHLSKFAFCKNTKGESKYRQDRLRKLLNTIVSSDLKFNDLERDLVIPTCKLYDNEKKRWKEKIYDTFSNSKESVTDVAIRSASAPIYFPSYQGYVDGGVFAVNPSLVAYSRLIDDSFGAKNSNDIRLLSIGSGINPTGIEGEIDWGLKNWMENDHKLLELCTDMGFKAPHYPLKQILKDQYRRINSELNEQVAIDDSKKMDILINSAVAFTNNKKNSWEKDKSWIKEEFLKAS